MNEKIFIEGPITGSYGHRCIKIFDSRGLFYLRSYDDMERAEACFIVPIIKELKKLGLPVPDEAKLESFLVYMITVGVKKNKSRKFKNYFTLADLRFFACSYIMGFLDGKEVKEHENY
jgi:hypothetical protein